jgi:outer membrane receptor protein involved in Fe transport
MAFILMLAAAMSLSAQTCNVQGTVLDGVTKAPLFYTRISLMENDSSVNELYMSFTGADGKFTVENVPAGDYVLKANLVGYNTLSLPIHIEDSETEKNLGEMLMPRQGKSLKEVTVASTKPVYLMEGEKTLYNVAEDPSIQTGTAADALQNAPGVEVDVEGNITLRGVSSVEIWLNGKPSHLNEESLKEFIKQLPANSLERIEVITNPSARYSAKSDGGIINIVTTSNIKKNSFVSFGIHGSSRPSVGPWVSYVWANEKWSLNLYAGMWYSLWKNKSESTALRLTNEMDTANYGYANQNSKNHNMSFNLNFNGTYTIDSMNTLSFWLGAYPGFGKSEAEAFTSRHERIFPQGFFERFDYTTLNNSRSTNAGAYMGVWYEHDFNEKGHKIEANIGGSFHYNDGSSFFDRDYTPQDYLDKKRDGLSKSVSYGFDAGLDYTIPYHENGEISVGVSGEYGNSTSLTRYDTLVRGTESLYVTDSLRFYDANTREGDFDAYVTIEHRFGGFTIKGGLRSQYIHYDLNIHNSPADNVVKGYWSLYPSLHLSYRTKSMHNFKLSYTRRVRNPSASQLTTYRNYSEDSFSVGNPDLLPTYTHSVDAGWTKFFQKFGSVGISAYYRNTKDQISSLQDVVFDPVFGRVVTFSQQINAGLSHNAGAELNVTWRPQSFMSIRLYANIYYSYSQFKFRDEQIQTVKNLGYSLRVNLWSKLWKMLEVHASLSYRSKSKSLFTTTRPSYSFDFGLRADFFKRKLSVHVSVNDLFNWNAQRSDSNNPYYITTNTSKYVSRYISAGITLRFGKMELESKASQGSQGGEGAPGGVE